MIDEKLTLPRWSGSLITELLTALGHLSIRVAKHIGPLCRGPHPRLGRLARFDMTSFKYLLDVLHPSEATTWA